ncbi:MAG: hypothetical protein O7D86_01775 [Proteobacteria bacterium]|nr:hypothetical protein [Pseudomonadota bacterium]
MTKYIILPTVPVIDHILHRFNQTEFVQYKKDAIDASYFLQLDKYDLNIEQSFLH